MKPITLMFLFGLSVMAGCLNTVPAVAPVKTVSDQSAVFEALAKAVESGSFSDSSQRFVKVAGRTLKAKGVKPPPGYDEALMPWMRNHKPSAAEAAELAANLRRLK